MIRIIARRLDSGAACNIGGPVEIAHRTFDIECPELETFLKSGKQMYCSAEVVGAELIEKS